MGIQFILMGILAEFIIRLYTTTTTELMTDSEIKTAKYR